MLLTTVFNQLGKLMKKKTIGAQDLVKEWWFTRKVRAMMKLCCYHTYKLFLMSYITVIN